MADLEGLKAQAIAQLQQALETVQDPATKEQIIMKLKELTGTTQYGPTTELMRKAQSGYGGYGSDSDQSGIMGALENTGITGGVQNALQGGLQRLQALRGQPNVPPNTAMHGPFLPPQAQQAPGSANGGFTNLPPSMIRQQEEARMADLRKKALMRQLLQQRQSGGM